jgi:hypothetical protein
MQVVKLVSNDDAPKESRQTLIACHLNISVCFLKVGDAENALLHSSQVTLPTRQHVPKSFFAEHKCALKLSSACTETLFVHVDERICAQQAHMRVNPETSKLT